MADEDTPRPAPGPGQAPEPPPAPEPRPTHGVLAERLQTARGHASGLRGNVSTVDMVRALDEEHSRLRGLDPDAEATEEDVRSVESLERNVQRAAGYNDEDDARQEWHEKRTSRAIGLAVVGLVLLVIVAIAAFFLIRRTGTTAAKTATDAVEDTYDQKFTRMYDSLGHVADRVAAIQTWQNDTARPKLIRLTAGLRNLRQELPRLEGLASNGPTRGTLDSLTGIVKQHGDTLVVYTGETRRIGVRVDTIVAQHQPKPKPAPRGGCLFGSGGRRPASSPVPKPPAPPAPVKK